MSTRHHLDPVGKRVVLFTLALIGLWMAPAWGQEEWVSVGDACRYFKGTTASSEHWDELGFDDSGWLQGTTGIGYSDDITYATALSDMRDNYVSFYTRIDFQVKNPDDVSSLELRIRYDDGFIAYINGREIARSANMRGASYGHNRVVDDSHDEEQAEDVFSFTTLGTGLLRAGDNVLAIQVHNTTEASSDAGLVPRLIAIGNLPPEALITVDYPRGTDAPVTVNFHASKSRDPEGAVVGYSFDFGDSSPLKSGTKPTATHRYPANGLYAAKLTVTDGEGATDTATINVLVGPPRTLFVDASMTGTLRAGDDSLRTYNPAARAPGSGTDTAYTTIEAASSAALAGDVIVIRGGTYHEVLRPQNSGDPGIPITYKNYDNEKVTIKDTPPLSHLTPDEEALDQRRQYGIYIYDKSHIVIEGLHITGVSGWARIVKSHHITLRYNEFTLAQATGTTGSLKLVHSHDNRILDNTLHDGNDNLLLIHSNRNVVQGNSFMKGRHTLWAIRAGSFNVMRNNYFHNEDQKIGEIYDNEHKTDPPVLYEAARHNLVENNTFAKTASSGDKSPYAGIQFAGQRCIIRKNQFYGIVGPALDLTLYSDEARYNYENRVYNNVFHNTDFAGIRLSGSSRGTFHDNVFKNNVLSKSLFVANDTRWPWYTQELAGKPVQFLIGRLDGFVFENNNLFNRFSGEPYLITYGMRSSSSSHTQQNLTWWQDEYPRLFQGNMQFDPLFVDEANHDFHIQETSPMIDAGAYLTNTVGSGTGTWMPVEDVMYFYDGFGIAGETGDSIQLNGQIQTARIMSIDYGSSRLKLDRSLSWREGQGVSLAYRGSAPDLGVHEYGGEKAEIAKSHSKTAHH